MAKQSLTNDPAATGRNSAKRRFFRNTGFSVLQTAITMVLAVLLVPFLLWRLGTEKYGLWLTLQIFSILGLVSLAEMGFQGAVVRYLVRFHSEGDALAFRRLLVTAFVLFLGIGLICSAALAAFANAAFLALFHIPAAYETEMRLTLSVFALGLPVAFPALILKAFFAGVQDVATLKIWEALDRIIFTLAIVGLLCFSQRLLYMVLVEQAVTLSLFGLFAYVARSRMPGWFSIDPRYAHRESLRGVIGLSSMVFATSISNQVYIKAPEALVGASLGPIALAHYQIATRIPRVLKTVQGSLNAAVLSYVAGIDSSNADAKRRFALLGLRFTYLLFVPVTVFVVIFAPDILRLWVGEEYAFLGRYVVLYALWQLTSLVVGFGNATLTRTAHYRRLVWQNLAINALFLVALVFALDRFGLVGAFVLLLVAGAVSGAVVLAACRAANGFSYGDFASRVLWGPVIGSASTGTVLFLGARWMLQTHGLLAGLVAIAMAGVAYMAVIYFTILDKTERGQLAEVSAKAHRSK